MPLRAAIIVLLVALLPSPAWARIALLVGGAGYELLRVHPQATTARRYGPQLPIGCVEGHVDQLHDTLSHERARDAV